MENHLEKTADDKKAPLGRETPRKMFYPQPGSSTIRNMCAPDYYNMSSISRFVEHVPWPYVRRKDDRQKDFFPFSGNHRVYPYYAKFFNLENAEALKTFIDNLVIFCVELNKCENFGLSRSKKLQNINHFCEVATKGRSQLFLDLCRLDRNMKINTDDGKPEIDLRYFTSGNNRLLPDVIGDLICKLIRKINESIEGCAEFTLVAVIRSLHYRTFIFLASSLYY